MNEVLIDGARIAITESGAGRPLLMLHCSASSGAMWNNVARWVGPGMRVVAPDLYGCGASARWQRLRPLRMDDHVKMVDEIAARLPGPVDLVGHSFGGAIALRAAIALQRQHKLNSLTLIEPVSFHLLRGGSAHDRRLYDQVTGLHGQVRSAILENDADRGMGRFVDYWNGPGSWDGLDPETRARLAPRAATVADDFAVTFADQTTIDAYGEITAPTMLVSGMMSPVPTQRISQILAAAIPGVEHVTISAGHMAPLTHPAVIGALVASHLDYTQLQQRRVA
jgi:pimeloyl-ACP methyl ester carboxylesterase